MTSTPVRPRPKNSDVNSTPVQANMERQKKRMLKKKIKETLLRFKFNELVTDMILNLFELEPLEVKEKLTELKLPSNKVSVATLLSSRSQAFNVPDLEDIHHSLLLYRTAFGSKQKKWVTVCLQEPAADMTFSSDEKLIRLNILQGLRIKGLNAVVKVITYEELIWVMIIEKKLVRRKGIRLMTPVFICYEVGLPYIFTASKISDVIMESILRAMKFKKQKLKQLEGKDVKSLVALLKYKMNGHASAMPLPESVTNQVQIKAGHRFFDVSKRKDRESYVNKVFDMKEPINLEKFIVTAEAVWRCGMVQEMKGEPFNITMKLKSKDLVGMVKHLVSTNVVPTPLPEYLQTIVRSAKNKVHMKTV